jgi:hypothetical protein
MKDLFGAFSTEVFRPLVTLVLPGVLGLSSWTVFALWTNKPLRNMVAANQSASVAILF